MILRLARLVLAFAIVLSPALAAPAWAQFLPGLTPGAGAEEASPEARSALADLLEVLRDEDARDALIAELERAVEDGPASGEAETETMLPIELRSIGGQIADGTQWMAEGAARSVITLVEQILAAPQIFAELTREDFLVVGTIALNLAALIAITYGGLLIMRRMTDRYRMAIKQEAIGEGIFAKAVAVTIALGIDVLSAVVPWAIGYVVALLVLGTRGDMSFDHSLYLNAFVMIEIAIAVLRAVFAPQKGKLRLVNLGDMQSRIVMRWARVFISLFVFGQFLLLPLFNREISLGAGRALSILGLMVVLGLAAFAVIRARKAVAFLAVRRLRRLRANKGFKILVRLWHVPVLLYLAGLAIVAITRPIEEFYVVLLANGQIAVAILVGMIVANLLSKLIGGGVRLPHQLSQRVPLLERRLNSFVPRMLSVLRFAVVAGVVVFCLHTLGVIDFLAFLESQFGARVAGTAITVAIILLIGFVLWLILNSWVDYRINPEFAVAVSARERTLLTLMRNALTITLILVMLMFILSEMGINIAPLLASAGVIGLAVGFGAQKLVQDIITGIFIQLEGAIDVGDVVSIGGISGVVERLTIRSASLRDLEGSYHIIPFSSVDTVTNFMRGFSFALLDMRVAYGEDIEQAKAAMHDAFAELRTEPDQRKTIIGELEWLGVDDLAASEMILRARIKTLPGNQWAVKRAYNAVIKRVFQERGIEIPFPHQKVYFGTDPSGTPPTPQADAGDDGGTSETKAKTAKRATPARSKAGAKSGSGTRSKAKAAPRRRKTAKPDTADLPDVDAGPDR